MQDKKLLQYLDNQETLNSNLQEAFVAFDATLVERPVVHELKRIAGVKELEDEEEDPEEVSNLYEEATMTIQDVIQKYEDREEAEAEDGEERPCPAGEVRLSFTLKSHY